MTTSYYYTFGEEHILNGVRMKDNYIEVVMPDESRMDPRALLLSLIDSLGGNGFAGEYQTTKVAEKRSLHTRLVLEHGNGF